MSSRRDLIKLIAVSPLIAAFSPLSLGDTNIQNQSLITRKIPSSSEFIPVVGMGSYQTFNIAAASGLADNLGEVLRTFIELGGCLLDSSPMYGRSEQVIGDLLSEFDPMPNVFAASKVWTYGKQAGIDSIKESMRKMQIKPIDLMQVHNLRDWKVHLQTLNELKAKELIRYTGITTSRINQYEDFEQVMKTQKLDFIQVNYNIKVREAEKRLLPLAMEKGIGVIVNMPYEKGRLFKLVKGQPLPEWASEFDCNSWGQFFLKFIISHPAVTCVIPATSKVHHMQDNMFGMRGRLPDEKMRAKMFQFFESI